jgi:predicted amidohydrolase YtcJ
VFVNGKIWTGDEKKPQAEALAIRGDRIVAVGTPEEVTKAVGADAAVVDLHGRLVVPGFQDSHAHWPGSSVNDEDLHGAETLREFQSRLASLPGHIRNCRGLKGMAGDIRRFRTRRQTRNILTR